MRILIADDDPQNRYYLEQVLRAQGHECVAVGDGKEALARLRHDPFDVVVSDVLMPKMDGFQLCREARNQPGREHIPFVFYTATYTEPEDRDLGLSLGATAYVIKPAEPEAIAAVITSAVEDSHQRHPDAELEETAFYELYNPRLVAKLESKLLQLEKTRRQLETSNAALTREMEKRTAAERVARESLSLFQATLSSSADGILAVDRTGQLVTVNPQMLTAFRLADPHRRNSTWAQLESRMRASTYSKSEFDSVFSRESTTLQESTLKLVDGGVLEVRRRTLLIDGAPAGHVWACTDATEQHRAQAREMELQRDLFESQQAASLGSLAAGIAHDFNNVLSVVLTGVDAVRMDLPAGHEALAPLAEIGHAAETGAALSRQILDFSRVSKPMPVSVNLSHAARGVMRLLKLMTPRRVELHLETQQEDIQAVVEPSQFAQVLLNLGANGVQAIEGHGRLTVSISSSSLTSADPHHPTLPLGSYAVLRVSDDGEGIDSYTAQHLFEPYYTTKRTGTGVGLTTVRRILDSWGASIHVSSETGRGTTFEVLLPMGGTPLAEESAPSTRSRPVTALLLEPNDAERAQLERFLTECGLNCLGFARPQQAIEAFRSDRSKFDIVVIGDSSAPASSVEIASIVRALRSDVSIVMTAFGDFAKAWESAPPTTRSEILPKPFNAKAVADTVARALSHRPRRDG